MHVVVAPLLVATNHGKTHRPADTEKLLRTAAAQVLADLNILGALGEVIVQSGPNPQVRQMLGAT